MRRARAYLATMRTVTAEQLRDELDHHLALAAAGETVVVEADDRGVVVEFRPAPKVPPWVTDPALADLIRRGVATPASRRPGSITIPPHDNTMSLEQLLSELDEDRADRDLPGQRGAAGRGVP